MGARNRENYSDYGSRRGGGMAVIRSLFIMVLLAGGSFLLGFFVLARLLPGNQKPDASGSNTVTNASDPGQNAAQNSAPAPRTSPPSSHRQPSQSSPALAPPTGAPHPVHPPSPSIDALSDEKDDNAKLQTPASPDNGSGNSASPGRSELNRTPTGSDTSNKMTSNKMATGETAATPRSRRRRHRTPDATDVQAAASPDNGTSETHSGTGASVLLNNGDTGTTETSRSARATNATPKSADGYYRLQLGVFSTRETAEQEAQRARDKGFEINIRPYTNAEGHKLYRVQHGIYRLRANAEAEKQRLTEAGFDASLSSP